MDTSTDSIPLLAQGLTFEDMAVGMAFRTASRTVTETDLMSFVHLGGFNEPLFMDMEFVARESVFKRRAAPGALMPAINCYRAVPFTAPSKQSDAVTVPTLYVYAGRDIALGPRAAELTGLHVTGPYRYERLDEATHWLPETSSDVVVRLLLEHLGHRDTAASAS